jgi:hypothetical protein
MMPSWQPEYMRWIGSLGQNPRKNWLAVPPNRNSGYHPFIRTQRIAPGQKLFDGQGFTFPTQNVVRPFCLPWILSRHRKKALGVSFDPRAATRIGEDVATTYG